MDLANMNSKLQEILIKKNIISQNMLDNLLNIYKGKDLQEVLLSEGLITKEELTDLLAQILGWEILEDKEFKPNELALKSIPSFLTKFYNFIPLKIEEKTLYVGFFPPVKPTAIEDIRLITGLLAKPYLLKIGEKKERILKEEPPS
ncbi:MAG TPA: type II secretion system protein GspE, partial [Dictyoglomaceae bacterium]|nr:type II secretion system protein GspE [Dictyoglomaceae bacterium]